MRITLLVLCLCILGFSPPPIPAQDAKPADPATKAADLYKAGSYAEAYEAAKQAFQNGGGDDSFALEMACKSAMALGEPATALKAAKMLANKRKNLSDYLLLMSASEMAGASDALKEASDAADSAKEPSPRGLYELAWDKSDSSGRLKLLQKISSAFPGSPAGIGPEIAFWEARPGLSFRQAEQPVQGDGVALELKTLYDLEWVESKTSSGEELWLMFDTAARMTVLSKDTAERMKLPLMQASFPPPGAYPEEPAPLYTIIDRLDFGGYTVKNIPALVVQDEVRLLTYREGRVVLKGIFGMDLLRGLKVRFDRQKNKLRLLPRGAQTQQLLDGDPTGWSEEPAFSSHGQVLVKSQAGKRKMLGLLATGAGPVLLASDSVPGTGLEPDSRKIINLCPINLLDQKSRSRHQKLGWLQECLPMVGQVRTIPKMSEIGFGPTLFQAKDMPLFPKSLGGDIPIGIVIGKEISDFYAIAFDLPERKMYIKKVLFGK